LCIIRVQNFEKARAQISTAHHSAYFGNRALEAARGAAFAEIHRFYKLIIVRVSSVMAG